jgi:histidinol-phosphatase
MLAGDPDQWPDDLAFAQELGRIASAIALSYFGSSSSHIKGDGTPVGPADLAVDAALGDLIRASYPEDAILSEESEPFGASTRRWILDPVDGTARFLAGEDGWGTHIALDEGGEIVLGLVTRPLLDEVWWALRGAGSWWATYRDGHLTDPVRLRVSDLDQLSQSRVTVWPSEQRPALVASLKESARWAEPDARSVLNLVEGNLEAVCAFAGGPWDHAPATILVEEAGGNFCDPAGGRRLDLGGAVYTNGRIDAELQALVRRR